MNPRPALTFVIFSKDRPLQVHGLLASLFRHCQEPVEVFVLYAASSDRLYLQYRQAFEAVNPLGVIHPVAETRPFADHVNTILSWVRTPYTAFLVDDIVFIRPFRPSLLRSDLARGAIASLRLGRNITYSYMTDRTMDLPRFRVRRRAAGSLLSWRWNQGGLDWCYPMSVDGNVFSTKEIARTVRSVTFKTPNSLEARLNDIAPPFRKRRGVCFERPVLVNIPANKVQTDLPGNRSGSVSVEALADLWDQGLGLDLSRYEGLEADAVHVECELHCVPRKANGVPG